jgi:hypothetical protein
MINDPSPLEPEMGEWSSAGDLIFGFPVRRRSRSARRWRMFSGNVWGQLGQDRRFVGLGRMEDEWGEVVYGD